MAAQLSLFLLQLFILKASTFCLGAHDRHQAKDEERLLHGAHLLAVTVTGFLRASTMEC